MKYPNNDLWSVRQIEFLKDALVGYENMTVDYYPERDNALSIPNIAEYSYRGMLHFPGKDRTIIFEQGKDFGLKETEIRAYLESLGIKPNVKH